MIFLKVLSSKKINEIDAYFRASNYLTVGQLYLMDNPLLKRPLKMCDIKPKVVGHFGTTPSQNFIYVHLNRIIKKYKLNMIYISGPGHGGNAMIAQSYLEGSYTKVYPGITQDEDGMKKLFKQFSFPGGVSSHVSPEVPGSINEGGELGYSLAHAFGAALDNKDLIVACCIGDGEAETGPLQASLHANKILNPYSDGVVLPILNLNGYKIANPTIFGRMSDDELYHYFVGCGWKPYLVSGNDVFYMHERMAKVLKEVVKDIKKIKNGSNVTNIKYPMIILRTPKGWLGPEFYDDKAIEGTFRAHQIPIPATLENIPLIEKWLRSYHPEELFDDNGTLNKNLQKLIPEEQLCMGNNPIANGGLLLKELKTPNFMDYEVKVETPGETMASDMMELGKYIKDLISLNKDNFLIFGPDEALSNRLNHVFDITDRKWTGTIYEDDEFLSPDGRVIDSILSEHVCEGILEGYLLTGRHGFMHSYEAFIRIVDSMASQHAKWLKICNELPWRKEIASLNYLLTSHIWQQDHNGFTHQDPGFINHLVTKKADTVRIYLPIDANTLICSFDHCIKTKNYINAIIASKHKTFQWLSMEEAIKHCEQGIGILNFASNCKTNPDIILACAGDTPTVEIIAASQILKEKLPKLKIRVVNIIDLMKLQSDEEHPHGLSQKEYDKIFTKEKPIIFAFHGYPTLIHQLTYKRENKNLHVHGYIEEGTITTPFDMKVKNKIDRFNIIKNALKYLETDIYEEKEIKEIIKWCNDKLEQHHEYIREHGIDLEEVRGWIYEEKE